MKFLSIFTPDPKTVSVPPGQEHIAEMGKLVEESLKAGSLLSTGMLLRDSTRSTRVRRSNGEITLIGKPGPLQEAADRKSGFAVLEAKSTEEAIELTRNFLKVAGDGECELCQIQVVDPGVGCLQA